MASGRDGAVLGSIRTLFGAGTSVGLDDTQLLDRFLAGRDEVAGAAFEALVSRHGPMVLGVCRETLRDAHDAQDAFQATFLVLARKAGSIRRRDSLASWLFGVARKVATRSKSDAARRRARERQAAVSEVVEPDPGREPEDLSALYEEIDRLPGTYRDPVILCYLDGMTYEAAARQLRCPLGTLSVRLKRARERLQSRLTRRGVAPSTLPIWGLIPGAITASVPIALAESAACAASRTTMGKATVAGAVPTSVASLAGRTMAMLRYRAIGIGSMGLGFVVLVATAFVAVRATEQKPGVPEPSSNAEAEKVPSPKSKEAPSWMRPLPGGGMIELFAVSEHPAGAMPFTGPVTWRKPDGTPIDSLPWRGGAIPEAIARKGEQVRDFVVKVGNLPGPDRTYRWQITPSGFNTVPSILVKDGTQLTDLSIVSVAIVGDRKACTVRIGVASEAWKTVAISKPGGTWTQDEGKVKVIFGKPREIDGKSYVAMSQDELPDDDIRIVALDRNDREHKPATATGTLGKFRFWEVECDLPLSEIKEFRLQTRPFEWAEFADVSLKPKGE